MAGTEIALVTYIVAAPETIWEALTHSDYTQLFFFGRRVESDWKTGSPVRYYMPDGTLAVEATLTQKQYPFRLGLRYRVCWTEQLSKRPQALVSYKIEDLKGVSRLSVREVHAEPLDEKAVKFSRRIWNITLSGLKTLLETGKPLPKFDVSK